jgi:hypothetical protein
MSGFVPRRGSLVALLALLALAPLLVRAQEPEPPPDLSVYLPAVMVAPVVSPIEFTDQLDGDTPVNPRSVFDYGITDMYASFLVRSGEGLTWRIEWDYPGFGTLEFDCEAVPNTAHCPIDSSIVRINPLLSNGGQPLNRGDYRVRVYLDDVLFQQGTAVIR